MMCEYMITKLYEYFWKILTEIHHPVSYTHLDVYKRQPFIHHREFFSELPNANLKLVDHNKTKTESNEAELHQAALHTVQKRFPTEQWIRIYTDGSSIPSTGAQGLVSTALYLKATSL